MSAAGVHLPIASRATRDKSGITTAFSEWLNQMRCVPPPPVLWGRRHGSRVIDDADRMREMINAIALAQVTIGQNEVVKRLAGWSGILAVPTMVFSLYGMNFAFIPELGCKWSSRL